MTNPLLKELKNKDWKFCYDRSMTYRKVRLFNFAYTKKLAGLFSVKLTSWLCAFKNGLGSEYYKESEYYHLNQAIQKKLTEGNKLFLKKISRSIDVPYLNFDAYVSSMPVEYQNFSQKKLVKAFTDYIHQENKVTLANWLVFEPFEMALTNVLKQLLQLEYNNEQAQTVFTTLSKPTRPISLDAQTLDLCKTVLAKNKQHSIMEFHKKYACTSMFDVQHEPRSIEETKKQLLSITKRKAFSISHKIKLKYYKQKKLTTRTLTNLKTSQLRNLANIFCIYANFKEWKNFYRQKSTYKLKFLMQEIATRCGFSLIDTAFLTDEEIVGLLKGLKKINEVDLKKRYKKSIFLYSRKLYILTQPDLIKNFFKRRNEKSSLLLKGFAAYAGKVTGTVRIVNSLNDIPAVTHNTVLVTSTTRAEYTEAIKKSLAVVTNEGGTLSHAAILARELKKPCVIGTKIATKVFKDGDRVEVDAHNGTVKKIS